MASPGTRKRYPTDVSDEEWAFAAPYLTLMEQEAPQRIYPLREVFNGLRYLAKCGSPWRLIPHDLPPWEVVYQQTQRWIRAQVFESMVHDLREVLRLREGRRPQPTAAVMDSRTLQSTPEKRCSKRLRWSQTEKGQQSSYRGRHTGASVGAACDPGR